MDVQTRINQIRDQLKAKAAALNVSVEQHAAEYINQLHANWTKVVLVVGAITFVLGAVVGYKL